MRFSGVEDIGLVSVRRRRRPPPQTARPATEPRREPAQSGAATAREPRRVSVMSGAAARELRRVSMAVREPAQLPSGAAAARRSSGATRRQSMQTGSHRQRVAAPRASRKSLCEASLHADRAAERVAVLLLVARDADVGEPLDRLRPVPHGDGEDLASHVHEQLAQAGGGGGRPAVSLNHARRPKGDRCTRSSR